MTTCTNSKTPLGDGWVPLCKRAGVRLPNFVVMDRVDRPLVRPGDTVRLVGSKSAMHVLVLDTDDDDGFHIAFDLSEPEVFVHGHTSSLSRSSQVSRKPFVSRPAIHQFPTTWETTPACLE